MDIHQMNSEEATRKKHVIFGRIVAQGCIMPSDLIELILSKGKVPCEECDFNKDICGRKI